MEPDGHLASGRPANLLGADAGEGAWGGAPFFCFHAAAPPTLGCLLRSKVTDCKGAWLLEVRALRSLRLVCFV